METLKPYQFFFLFLLICLAACAPASSASKPGGFVETVIATPEIIKVTAILNPTPTESFTHSQTNTPLPTSTETPPPLEIVVDTNPEKLPSLSWEYITSEQFIKDLMEMDRRGLLPDVPDTAISLSTKNLIVYIPDTTIDSAMRKKYGVDNLFTISMTYPYTTLKNRPWVIAGVWLTEFNGARGFAFVNKWKNSDGTYGYLGYFSFPNGPVSLSEKLNAIISETSDTGVLPSGLFFSGVQGCESIMSNFKINSTSFCQWYMDRSDITLAPETYRNWAKTGILTNRISGKNIEDTFILPFTIVGFYNIR